VSTNSKASLGNGSCTPSEATSSTLDPNSNGAARMGRTSRCGKPCKTHSRWRPVVPEPRGRHLMSHEPLRGIVRCAGWHVSY
jgi:hypothetical protein